MCMEGAADSTLVEPVESMNGPWRLPRMMFNDTATSMMTCREEKVDKESTRTTELSSARAMSQAEIGESLTVLGAQQGGERERAVYRHQYHTVGVYVRLRELQNREWMMGIKAVLVAFEKGDDVFVTSNGGVEASMRMDTKVWSLSWRCETTTHSLSSQFGHASDGELGGFRMLHAIGVPTSHSNSFSDSAENRDHRTLALGSKELSHHGAIVARLTAVSKTATRASPVRRQAPWRYSIDLMLSDADC
eukprot:gene41105-50871_t